MDYTHFICSFVLQEKEKKRKKSYETKTDRKKKTT